MIDPELKNAAADEIDRLHAERDDKARLLDAACRRLADYNREIVKVRAEVKRLRGALKPFADAFKRRPNLIDAHPIYDLGEISDSPAAGLITYGDLRAASQALEPKP